MGEFYRMNLSCSGDLEGLPESATGCLFFKVRGESNVTTGKNIINFILKNNIH